MKLRVAVVASLGLAALAVPDAARAQPYELKHDVPLDLGVMLGAAAIVFTSEAIFKPELTPTRCRWCDRDGEGNDALNHLDGTTRTLLKWEDTKLAAGISDALGFVAMPVASFGTLTASSAVDHVEDNVGVDMLLVGETVMLSGLLNQAVKFTAGRERPFVHALPDEETKGKTRHPTDNNLSFYSGHSSLTFSIAAASSTIASLRGYRLAPLVWATTGAIAATTAYLRIAADKHYLTDVLTGVAVGTAMGIVVPILFHGRRGEDVTTTEIAAQPLAPTPMATLGGRF